GVFFCSSRRRRTRSKRDWSSDVCSSDLRSTCAASSGGWGMSVMTLRLSSVSENARPRLLIIDGHSMAYRAFFALPAENFSTSTGQVTNAVYGFTSMLINLLRDEEPTHVAVAFDVSSDTFRKETYPDYKGT